MRKKKAGIIFIIVILLFAGLIALTQEADEFSPGAGARQELYGENEDSGAVSGAFSEDFYSDNKTARKMPEWVKPARWFRSNAGGMALEEIPSRLAALRNEYALVIDFAGPEELPEHLLKYYDDEYFIENRKLYKNGEETRVQWLFRDINGTTRLIAVFREPKVTENDDVKDDVIKDDVIKDDAVNDDFIKNDVVKDDIAKDDDAILDEVVFENAETNVAESGIENDGAAVHDLVIHDLVIHDGVIHDGVEVDDEIALEDGGVKEKGETVKRERNTLQGFVEIYDKNSLLLSEHRFFEDGNVIKTEFNYKNNIIISARVFSLEEDSGEFIETYADFFRYNRSSFLRAVERRFYTDGDISRMENPLRISFPGNILDAAKNDFFMSEKMNTYPEFFGDLSVRKDSRIVFTTDDRGRVLTQTHIDSEDNVIWVIKNTWQDERIVSTSKTQGDIELLAEYEYNSAGDRIVERNIRNGILERLVRTENKRDIEDLYFNNVVVLQAIWEDGRKISERRMGSRR